MNPNSDSILIFTPVITNRTKYIFQLFFAELLGVDFQLSNNAEVAASFHGAVLNYSNQNIENSLQISPAGLLEEKGINSHKISFIDYTDHKVPFAVYSKASAFPFDPFSAAFYLVTRYEEYLPYIRDEHGRFSSSSSLAYQKGFIGIPVINRWAKDLAVRMKGVFPGIAFRFPEYKFLPTIDIDAAWAYKNKGMIRTIGGFFKALAAKDFHDIKSRFNTIIGIEKDPFDTFALMKELHDRYDLRPVFFILFAEYGFNDKNIPTNNKRFQELIKTIADYAGVGIHPSYASNSKPNLLASEITALSNVLHKEITCSRQHFLKLSLPETYRRLIDNDIKDDFTMGFAATPGFRAGICTSFLWYDLESEVVTKLRIHPFAVMDGTLLDYMKLDFQSAAEFIKPLIDEVKNVGGTFISLWHNESLSDDKRWKGWVKVYEEMLEYAVYKQLM
ncbi:MAG: polysaccharide deacetylase family protein [Lentimicrobium sp.]|nr:polysaccharide deacetylase family protein [Lentimicrobium sp.]